MRREGSLELKTKLWNYFLYWISERKGLSYFVPCGLLPPPSKFYSRHKTAGAPFPIGLGRLGERRFGDKIQNYGGAEAFIGLTGPFYGSREEWRIFTTFSGATKGCFGPPSAQFDVRTRDERNFCHKVGIFWDRKRS